MTATIPAFESLIGPFPWSPSADAAMADDAATSALQSPCPATYSCTIFAVSWSTAASTARTRSATSCVMSSTMGWSLLSGLNRPVVDHGAIFPPQLTMIVRSWCESGFVSPPTHCSPIT